MNDEDLKQYAKTDADARRLKDFFEDPLIMKMLETMESVSINKLIDAMEEAETAEHRATIKVVRSLRQNNSVMQIHGNTARNQIDAHKRSRK